MSQGFSPVDPVAVTTALLGYHQETGVLHVPDNLLYRAFRDADIGRDVPEARLAVPRQANQHVSVIAEKCPITHLEPSLQCPVSHLRPMGEL
jgi:hypothetical protein